MSCWIDLPLIIRELSLCIDVGSKDISKEDFVSQFLEAAGYPHVVINGQDIGGLVETAKYLLKKKLATCQKWDRGCYK